MRLRRVLAIAIAVLVVTVFILRWTPAFARMESAEIASSVIVLLVALLFFVRLVLFVFDFFFRQPERRKWGRRLLAFAILLPICVFAFVAGSDMYGRHLQLFEDARLALNRSDIAKSALGEPVKVGWPVEVDMNLVGDSGSAQLSIPLKGSRVNGFLYVRGTKSAGIWETDEVQFSASGNTEKTAIYSH